MSRMKTSEGEVVSKRTVFWFLEDPVVPTGEAVLCRGAGGKPILRGRQLLTVLVVKEKQPILSR